MAGLWSNLGGPRLTPSCVRSYFLYALSMSVCLPLSLCPHLMPISHMLSYSFPCVSGPLSSVAPFSQCTVCGLLLYGSRARRQGFFSVVPCFPPYVASQRALIRRKCIKKKELREARERTLRIYANTGMYIRTTMCYRCTWRFFCFVYRGNGY